MARINLELAQDLPQNHTPLEMVAIVKCLDENGEPSLSVRVTSGLTEWEMVGMLVTAADQARRAMTNSFEDIDDLGEDGGDAR